MSTASRPEPVAFIMNAADKATDDKEYQVTFRAWQLRELRDYITSLEAHHDR